MKTRFVTAVFVALTVLASLHAQGGRGSRAASSAQKKFDHIARNAQRQQPDPKPTVVTEEEMNAWLAENRARLPRGVDSLRLDGTGPGALAGHASVDFDELTAGRRDANPLLRLFSGTHEIEVAALGEGKGGGALIRVQSVIINGVPVPRMALELFIERYVKPRWPNVGMETRFRMPSRVDSAAVDSDKITIVQK
jgi:hypothetical protein